MKIGFVGLGTMGASMAMNILKAGHPLTVFNRTRERAEPLIKEGAVGADSPRDVAAASEVIVTCVSDSPDVREVLLGENGIIHGAGSGTVVVDCSTISPKATIEFGKALAEKGIGLVDAPVSGGSEGAKRGTLTIMLGGELEHVEKSQPVLEAMGKTITHVGPLGTGQLTKAINQIVCGGNYLAVAEGITLGLKAGLDIEKVVAAIRGGAAQSWVLDNRSNNMIDNHFPLGFRIRLHRKDLEYALEAAREFEVSLPLTSLIAQMENGLIAQGKGDEDLSAIVRVIREQSGL